MKENKEGFSWNPVNVRKLHEFFGEYANLPMDRRLVPLDFAKYGIYTSMSTLYKEIHDLSDEMRPLQIKMDELLHNASYYLDVLKKNPL